MSGAASLHVAYLIYCRPKMRPDIDMPPISSEAGVVLAILAYGDDLVVISLEPRAPTRRSWRISCTSYYIPGGVPAWYLWAGRASALSRL